VSAYTRNVCESIVNDDGCNELRPIGGFALIVELKHTAVFVAFALRNRSFGK
jgi:hypothetical protein